jgi:endonuclease/exonuclease/phosphatase family metal-dependent hydrolase
MIYNKNTMQLIKGQNVAVENVYTAPVTWGLFESKETGEQFIVITTHFNPHKEETRLIEAEYIGKYVKELSAQYQVPIIITGDFNSPVNSTEHSTFMNYSGLTMLSETYIVNPPNVDHFFGSTTIDVIATGLTMGNGGQYASDHYPAWIDIKLSK